MRRSARVLTAASLVLLALPPPAAHAGAPAPSEVFANLLGSGIDEELVAEEAGCPDVAALHLFLAGGEAGGAGEYATLSAPFAEGTSAVQQGTRSALFAERQGLRPSASLAFSLFQTSLVSPARELGGGGFRFSVMRTPAFGSHFDAFPPFGDPFSRFAAFGHAPFDSER